MFARPMPMRHAYHALFIAAVSGLAVGAVAMNEGPAPSKPAALTPPPPAHTHAYSPFAVRLSGHPDFEVITFKRVGAAVPHSSDPSYEEVAESLAHRLRVRVMSEVVHVPSYSTPTPTSFATPTTSTWTSGAPLRGGATASGLGVETTTASPGPSSRWRAGILSTL